MHFRQRFDHAPIRPLDMSHAILILLAVLLVLPAGPSIAKNATTSLQEIVVSASRTPEMKRETTTNIQVIGQEDIELSTADTLGELLAEKSIGHIHKYPGASTSIGIRGFRTETHGNDLKGRVLILLNGRRAGTGNVAKIMTENVERIEIIRGPSSVQYGSAAIGGLVNVITKQGQGEPSGFVQGGLGSFDRQSAGAGVSGEVKGFDFSGSYSRSTRDNYTTADGTKYLNTGYDSIEHGSINLGYTFLPGNRISLIYTGFDADKVGLPGKLKANDLDDYANKSNESLDFIYDGSTTNELFSWKARYFTGYDEYTTFDPTESDPDNASMLDSGVPSQRETDQQGLQAQLTYDPSQYQITAGFDWVNYEIESFHSFGYSYELVGTTYENYYEYEYEYEYDNPSYFLLGKTRLMDKSLFLSAGLRYDQYDLKSQRGRGGEEDDTNWTKNIGISYLPINNIKLRANYSEGFKMPSAEQLAGDYESAVTGAPVKGNPDLEPEKSKTYEAGLDVFYQAFETSLTYFYTDFEDKIQSVGTSPQTWQNIGEATLSGLEGKLSYDFSTLISSKWSFVPYGSFVYMTEYQDEKTNKDLPQVSDLTASWGLRISDNRGFSGNLNFSYTGEQRITYPQDMQKGGFTVANLSLSQKIADIGKFGDLTLRGEIRNLLNKDYSYVEGYPMPGRSFFLEAKYRF